MSRISSFTFVEITFFYDTKQNGKNTDVNLKITVWF